MNKQDIHEMEQQAEQPNAAANTVVCVFNPDIWAITGDSDFDERNFGAWSAVLRIFHKVTKSEDGLNNLLPILSHVLVDKSNGDIYGFVGGSNKHKLLAFQPSKRKLMPSAILSGEACITGPSQIDYIRENQAKFSRIESGRVIFKCEKCDADYLPTDTINRFIFKRKHEPTRFKGRTFDHGALCPKCMHKCISADSMLKGYYDRKHAAKQLCVQELLDELNDV